MCMNAKGKMTVFLISSDTFSCAAISSCHTFTEKSSAGAASPDNLLTMKDYRPRPWLQPVKKHPAQKVFAK